MPELPEVETVARTLAPQVCGRRIVGVDVFNAGSWQGATAAEAVADRRLSVVGTGRRGKLLLLYLSRESSPRSAPDEEIPAPTAASLWPLFYSVRGVERGRPSLCGETPCEVTALAFHLRMTGRLFVYPAGAKPEKHTRVVFTLDDGRLLFFDDTRKFGQVRALSTREMESWNFWRELGPEPLEVSEGEFAARFSSGRAVKALLLDQSVVAGVGNIYADESLFRAGIRPDAPGKSLSADRLCRLHHALAEVLLESIRECGSSIRDYRTARGDVGAFQNRFRVYGRAGEPCVVCGTKLRSGRVAGRSTVWCPHCQTL
ncbi:bifunctional DNA-formamidopyrimidine glycosylase/DNA-(apurinic or apyrimidinic site) lyase [Mailhella sp.]|uniref:bifunctional DNA-formamidopyrimidine glycosylase/DNA-(apurinic or apyrimidinic site) lyase n=1 Tax=Mailhella sp. TaxID=1981029 RepID=UPI003AB7A9F5